MPDDGGIGDERVDEDQIEHAVQDDVAGDAVKFPGEVVRCKCDHVIPGHFNEMIPEDGNYVRDEPCELRLLIRWRGMGPARTAAARGGGANGPQLGAGRTARWRRPRTLRRMAPEALRR